MIILDKPYVSDFLKDTLVKYQYPVLKNAVTQELGLPAEVNYLSEADAIQRVRENRREPLYSNSENSINWVTRNLSFSDLPAKIDLFKNKVKFRKLIASLYPDFFFKDVAFDDLDSLDVQKIETPFIIKPAVGFFSMGVYVVENKSDWPNVLKSIKDEMERVKGLYPLEVMDSSTFIIEQNIHGEEYAIDAYFDEQWHPIIVNIFKHPFSSAKDVSDRIYLTSKEIIEENFECVNRLLEKLGNLANLSNFPMHIEVRIDENKNIIPIEVNPMRFAGWCLTDLAYFAYDVNPYQCYAEQLRPDWDKILKDKAGKIYAFVLADVPSTVSQESIASFDYDSYSKNFFRVLEMRKIDFKEHPIFALSFVEVQNYSQIDRILREDLNQYIKKK